MGFDLSKLGVKRNVPRVNFTEYSGVLSAPPKFGKTTMASMYPNSIILAFEKGYKAQDVAVRDMNKWEDFVNFVDLLEKNIKEIGDSVQTIIIDTVDEAYPMAEPYMCRLEGRKDGALYKDKRDVPYGQGWALHDQYFKEQTGRIYDLGLSILYITHSKVKTIRPKNAEEYDVYSSSMSDRLEAIVFPECDYILYGERIKIGDGNGNDIIKRKLTTQGTDELEAGNRVYLESDIVFDTEEEAMEEFQAAFRESILKNIKKGNDGKEVDVEALSKQQSKEKKERVAEHVDNIKAIDVEKNNELIEQVKNNLTKIDADKMKKIMADNKVENFSEPDTIETKVLEEIVKLIK